MSNADQPRFDTVTGARIDPWKRIAALESELAWATGEKEKLTAIVAARPSLATSKGTPQGRVADLEETFDPDPQDWEAARHNQADNYIAMKHLALELQRELDWSDHNWTSMVRRAERAEEKLHKIDVSLNAAGAPEEGDFAGVRTKLSRRGRLRALVDDLEGKLDAVAEALDHPKRAWRMAGCDVLAHQVRDLLRNYIALRDAPTALSPLAAPKKIYDHIADAVNEVAEAANAAFEKAGLEPGEWDGDNIVQDVKRGIAADIARLAARSHSATLLTAQDDCLTCHGDPAVCASIPGLRHCEKAMRETAPSTLGEKDK